MPPVEMSRILKEELVPFNIELNSPLAKKWEPLEEDLGKVRILEVLATASCKEDKDV